MDFREILCRKINQPVAISIINCCEVIVGTLIHVEEGFIQLMDLTGHVIDIPFCAITAVHEAQPTLGNCFGACARYAYGPCGGRALSMFYDGDGYEDGYYPGNGYYPGYGYDGKRKCGGVYDRPGC